MKTPRSIETGKDRNGTGRGRPSRSIWLFLALAFGFSWAGWGLLILTEKRGVDITFPPFLLLIVGGFGPMFAAIVASAVEGGTNVRELFGQLRRWRVGRQWYLFLCAIFVLRLVPVVTHVLAGGTLDIGAIPGQLLALPLIFLFIAVAGGGLDEEMGWRGFALPRLQAVLSPGRANLLLGVIWSCWHIPLWFVAGSAHSDMSFSIYLIGTTALSFLLGWIYNGAGGSLLLAVLAHAASNTGDNLRYVAIGVGVAGSGWPETGIALTMIIAALVVFRSTRGRLGLGPVPDVPPVKNLAHSRRPPRWLEGILAERPRFFIAAIAVDGTGVTSIYRKRHLHDLETAPSFFGTDVLIFIHQDPAIAVDQRLAQRLGLGL